MKTTLSERDGNTVKLAVEVSAEELQEAFSTHLQKLSREVRIPGFRPGKAPVTMVRQRLGDEAVLVEAVEESMSGWFADAATELGIDPVDQPQIELDDEIPDMDKPLGFKATVTVMPEVALGEYKGLKVPKDPVAVSDEEVDRQMSRLRDEFAELRPVGDRPVQKGDFVTADLRATLDGKPMEELEASDFVFEVGGQRIFPEVEEKAVGMNVGEERTFPLELPEGLPEEVAGKTADFTIALKEIKEKELPPLTDQWVSEISEFATESELRQEIRNKILFGREHASEQGFRDLAIQAATDNAEVDIPEVVVRGHAAEMLSDFKRSLESQGGSLEGYVAMSGTSVEQIIEDMKPQAANNVKTWLVLDAIVKAEGIEATDEEISAAIAQMAAASKMDVKSVVKMLDQGRRLGSLKEQILREKAVEWIAKNAVQVAPEPKDAKPASKAAKAGTKAAKADEPAPEASEQPESKEAPEIASDTGAEAS